MRTYSLKLCQTGQYPRDGESTFMNTDQLLRLFTSIPPSPRNGLPTRPFHARTQRFSISFLVASVVTVTST
jgi:hypothetical protein